MGLPARDRRQTRSSRPRLRLVKSQRRRGRSSSVSAQAARQLFAVVTVVLVALAVFGLGRVAISARAVEAAVDAAAIEEAIKAERLEGDMLEIEESALGTPSRIEKIASESMRMAEACDVCYIEVPDAETQATAEPADPPLESAGTAATIDDETMPKLAEAVMGLAVSEVQSLLVGDVGLASSR